MRKVLWLAAGVTVVAAAAFYVGAAAAMTGAPVFTDARYPQAAPPAVDGSEASAAEPVPAQSGAIDESPADGRGGAGEAAPAPQETPDAPPPEASTPGGGAAAPAPSDEAPQAPRRGTPSGEFGVPGGPAPDDAPGGIPAPEDQHAWLAFQQIVRDCMSAQGQEYLYWEWWNYEGDGSNRYPAMPADLTHREAAAWELALNGTSRGGDQYRWENAGCWGFAGHRIGAVG